MTISCPCRNTRRSRMRRCLVDSEPWLDWMGRRRCLLRSRLKVTILLVEGKSAHLRHRLRKPRLPPSILLLGKIQTWLRVMHRFNAHVEVRYGRRRRSGILRPWPPYRMSELRRHSRRRAPYQHPARQPHHPRLHGSFSEHTAMRLSARCARVHHRAYWTAGKRPFHLRPRNSSSLGPRHHH